MLGWSIVWEVIHSKVKGIQLNGKTLEAIYKSKRSGVSYICCMYSYIASHGKLAIATRICMCMCTQFNKLQSKYNERFQLPTKEVQVARVSEYTVVIVTYTCDYYRMLLT